MIASSPRQRALALAAAVALALAGVALVAAPASAATLTVTSTGDTGPGTLSDAINTANTSPGLDTISFALPSGSAIALTTALPEITDSLTITGPAGGIVIDGSGVATGEGLQAEACGPVIDLNVTDLTVSGFPGDGIDFECSNVTLTQVTATANGDVGIAVNATAGGKAVLTDVTASGNASTGIRMMTTDAGSESTLTRVTATGTQGAGADLAVDVGGEVTVADSHFDANASGGLIASAGTGGVEHISGSSFDGNNPLGTSTLGGLLVASAGGTITVDDSEMSDNHSLFGAGIDVPSLEGGGVVSITHARVERNTASFNGAGLGGGVFVQEPEGNGSHFTIADSVVSGNTSDESGGGIYLLVDPALTQTGGTSIVRTTVDGNSSDVGGGIYIDGWTDNYTPGAPTVDITTSTISNNTAREAGGILASDSSASTPDSLILLDSSTVSSNTATGGTGGLLLAGIGAPSAFRVAHSTIASNTGSNGEPGGIYTRDPLNLTLDHTVVAGNGATDVQLDDPLTPLTASWSLVQNPDVTTLGALSAGAGNLHGVSAQLGPLADNGGPTFTMLPAATSPLIDAGNPAITGAPATDQRGSARLVRTIDIGAVEVQGARPAALAATGATPVPLALGGVLILLAGLLLVARRRRSV